MRDPLWSLDADQESLSPGRSRTTTERKAIRPLTEVKISTFVVLVSFVLQVAARFHLGQPVELDCSLRVHALQQSGVTHIHQLPGIQRAVPESGESIN